MGTYDSGGNNPYPIGDVPSSSVIPVVSNITLAPIHYGYVLDVTAPGITITAPSTLPNGFECSVFARTTGCTIDGPGGPNLNMTAGDLAQIRVVGSDIITTKQTTAAV